MTEPWHMTATELAARIADRDLSCVEVVEAHLARIAATNPAVNAVVRVLADDARRAAELADQAVARGAPLGPLHGVPITVKENIDLAGTPTTWGVPALANAVPPVDAPVVERMRAAGAIVIGRTNLPDMGLRVHTDGSLHGLTRNPWNPGRTAGGSSGGEAAAIATGMSPLGLGNDLGGSLRNPANACGIASIRPSAGRVPNAGFVPAEDDILAIQLMGVQGPMARRVDDLRLALEVLSGAHPRDPWSVDVPLAGPRLPHPIRVAMVAEPPGGSTDPRIAAIVRRAGAALVDAGYVVSEVCPPRYEEVSDAWAQLLFGDIAVMRGALLSMMSAAAVDFFTRLEALTPPMDAAAMSGLHTRRLSIGRAWAQFLADYPLVLSPTWTQLPFEHGFDVATTGGSAATLEMMRPVLPANLLGLPSACVPAGHDAATNLPVGVLLTGRRFREDTCLDAAREIETRLGLPTPIDPFLPAGLHEPGRGPTARPESQS